MLFLQSKLDLLYQNRASPLFEILDIEGERRFPFQEESSPSRFLRRAERIALFLIDDAGDFNVIKLKELLHLLEQQGSIFFPLGLSDEFYQDHLIRQLRAFSTHPLLMKKLRRFLLPVANSWVEELVRLSTQIEGRIGLKDLRRAVFSACLVPLRQNVGSCFATAPAILIQREELSLFLDDLYELLFTGRLKRVIGGAEYVVPLAPSLGSGLLHERFSEKLTPGIQRVIERAHICCEELTSLSYEKTISSILRDMVLKRFHLQESDMQASFTAYGIHIVGAREGKILEARSLERMCRLIFCSVFDHPLLKVWEFTLASFSEAKMEFSSWNLYLGLGLHPENQGGIGEIVFAYMQAELSKVQQHGEELHFEYERAKDGARTLESLLRTAATEKEAKRLNVELQASLYHMRSLQDMRDSAYGEASHYVQFPSHLISHYENLFPLYFQEIYDPDMGVFSEFYGDSPAGFRLVYKHGRSDPSQWTLIDTERAYVNALIDFFVMIEGQVATFFDFEKAPELIAQIHTAIITHLRSLLFIQTAKKRIQSAYQQMPGALRSDVRTPWSYISGGTLPTLCKTYFRYEKEIQEEKREVENPQDLLIFLIDTLKNLPPKMVRQHHDLLMTSPSHAFTLDPESPLFFKAWQDPHFTYTWVRDELIHPQIQFYDKIVLSSSEQEFLGKKWHPIYESLSIPKQGSLSLISWKEAVLNSLSLRTHVQELSSSLDSFLYESLPLTPSTHCFFAITQLLLPWLDVSSLLDEMTPPQEMFVTALELKEMAKRLYVTTQNKVALSFDLHRAIEERARDLNLSPHPPLLFGDTNWATYYFGFMVSPSSQELALWRCNPLGSRGVPMTCWKRDFGSFPWTLYPGLHV